MMSLVVVGFIISYVRLFNTRKKRHLEEKEQMKENFHLQLLHSKLEIQEQTFTEISKELHDNVGQLLSLASLQLSMAQQQAIPLEKIKQNIDTALGDLRNISKSLNGEYIQKFSIAEFLQNIKNQLDGFEGIDFQIEQIGERSTLPIPKKIILIRVLQEAIQNIVKHARATLLRVIIDNSDGQILKITVADNGIGFDVKKAELRNGLGLSNMQKRIESLNGTITFHSRPSEGTEIFIHTPL